MGRPAPVWISPERVNSMSIHEYRRFLESYEGKKAELKILKDELAGY
jgi:hypothetical protein